MRTFAVFTTLLFILAVVKPTLADDSISDGIKAKALPLLKALSMIGTPYKLGGQNPIKGVDCSGFVKHVYKDTANIELPRTARAMSHEGEKVAKNELKPGDLVFFGTRKKSVSHVGIYAGNGEFVHASSRKYKEVMVSSLDDGYWAKRFHGARRVLSEQESGPPADPQ